VNNVTAMDKLDRQIDIAKDRLYALYAKRRELRDKLKGPIGPSHEERIAKVVRLAKRGVSFDDISPQVGWTAGTVKDKFRSYLWDEAHESLLRKGRATVRRPNEVGGESWECDYEELKAEMRAINDTFPTRLSPAKMK